MPDSEGFFCWYCTECVELRDVLSAPPLYGHERTHWKQVGYDTYGPLWKVCGPVTPIQSGFSKAA